MAELGVIASIVGIAGAGIRLSLILNAVSCEVANAGYEVQTISRGISSFSLMLKQTGAVLQATNSVHSKEAVDATKTIADESKRVFDEINDMLDRVRGKRGNGALGPTLQQRFRSCFKKHRVLYLLAQLESLKLSLSVMLQILQLGSLMAATSKNDPPEVVTVKSEAIQQERLETQNTIIIRHWQISQLDDLFEDLVEESKKDKLAEIEDDHSADGEALSIVSSASSQLTVLASPPPEYESSTSLSKLPVPSLGDAEPQMHGLKDGAKEMIQISNDAVDMLLERWTVWYHLREKRHSRHSGSSYGASVQQDHEEDEEKSYYERYQEREDSPRGYYLEGPTSDWRKPHSLAARQEALRRKQQYTRYQASVSAASSDAEDSPRSNASRKGASRRHIIDSSSESSESEHEQPLSRRRSSTSAPPDRKAAKVDSTPLSHAHSASQSSFKSATSAGSNVSHPGNKSPISSRQAQIPRRPSATPEQHRLQHSFSSPVPPVHTGNAPNPYSNTNAAYMPYHIPPPPPPPATSVPQLNQTQYQPSPLPLPPPPQQQQQQQQQQQYPYNYYYGPPNSRYPPPTMPRMAIPGNGRPGSKDGTLSRSPSRLSPHASYTRSYSGRHDEDRGFTRYDDDRRHSRHEEEKRATKEKNIKKLKEGATKSLIGAGALAGFLEALEGLNM